MTGKKSNTLINVKSLLNSLKITVLDNQSMGKLHYNMVTIL